MCRGIDPAYLTTWPALAGSKSKATPNGAANSEHVLSRPPDHLKVGQTGRTACVEIRMIAAHIRLDCWRRKGESGEVMMLVAFNACEAERRLNLSFWRKSVESRNRMRPASEM